MHLTDDELLARTKAAHQAAHDAPLAEIYEVNKGGKPTGVKHISNHVTGWADRSREWMDLANEVDRRGLQQPKMDWDGDSRR